MDEILEGVSSHTLDKIIPVDGVPLNNFVD